MIGKPNHLLQHYFWCHTTSSSSRPQAKKVVVVRCQMIGVPNPIITFFGFDQYRQNYWIRTQNGEQVSRVVVIVYQKSLNLCGKNCILSCSRGRRSRLFVVTASLTQAIEKLHNFFEEARMLSCEMSRLNIIHQWIIFWDMNERKTSSTECKVL